MDFSLPLGTHSIMQCDMPGDCSNTFLRLNMEPWKEAEALRFRVFATLEPLPRASGSCIPKYDVNSHVRVKTARE